jgi:uncharacterized membrane protein YphA (DoxX/SURF4 family)
MFPFLRIFIGLIFVVSGGEKLIWPYQNFLYVIQGYQLLPPGLDEAAARIFPWIEFLLGLFLVLGFWLPFALRGVLVMLTMFILVVSQAIIRKLPLGECGCFGQLISFPLPMVVLMDSGLFVLTFLALANLKKTEALGLDRYFQK